MEFYIVSLFFAVIWGLICMNMAENRGRSRSNGFVVGALFGIFGVIYYWIAGDTPKLRVKKEVELEKYKESLKK